MRVTISSSSNDSIDVKYKESAIKVCDYLAENEWDLNWGSGSISIMGICYDEFSKYNRNIYGYTSPKYADDIENLPNAKHEIYDTTFDLKKHIFIDADMLLMLPGGTGTISEFFAYLEEIRSNDVNIPLVIYNEDHLFDSTLALIDDLITKNFNRSNIYDYFKVANSFEEFKAIVDKINNTIKKKHI
ncbi:MAG: LOG family protein [Bacilli bacterium]|nr:LOG family protein [Bacilli bacterium]